MTSICGRPALHSALQSKFVDAIDVLGVDRDLERRMRSPPTGCFRASKLNCWPANSVTPMTVQVGSSKSRIVRAVMGRRDLAPFAAHPQSWGRRTGSWAKQSAASRRSEWQVSDSADTDRRNLTDRTQS